MAYEDIIKENNLPEDSAMFSYEFFRKVTEKYSGESKLIEKAKLFWTISQITNLQATLDQLLSKVSDPDLKSMLGYVKADGTISGSGMQLQTLTGIVNIDLLYSGCYAFENGNTAYSDLYGTIYQIIAMPDNGIGETTIPASHNQCFQLIFATKGIFYRTFNGSSWGFARYIGGGQMNYEATRERLLEIRNAGQLTPGALFLLNDHSNDNGIVLQAATPSAFNPNCIRLGLSPKHYKAQTIDGYTWIGTWRNTKTVAVGNLAVFYGRVWVNLTGSIGTSTLYDLDAVNWQMKQVISGAFYEDMIYSCVYDIYANFIITQKDVRYNMELGSGIVIDTDLTDYNDWNINADYNYPVVLNVKQNRLANNYIVGHDNKASIYNVSGTGSIYDNDFEIVNHIMANVVNNGVFSLCSSVKISDTNIHADLTAIEFNTFSITGSEIYSPINTIELTANQKYRESPSNLINAVLGIAAGTFTIPVGTGWSNSTTVTGGVATTVRSNGIIITPSSFQCLYAGWYHVTSGTSAKSSVKCNLETVICVNGNPILSTANIKTYNAVGDYVWSEVQGDILLAVGDLVTLKYRHDATPTSPTFTSYMTRSDIEYHN